MNNFLLISFIFFTSSLSLFSQTPTSTPKPIIGGVVNGKAIDLAKPAYPDSAQKEKVSGKVEVQVTIDEQGNVISAKAISGPLELREVSEKAALSSKFLPTKLEGEPVKVSGVIIYNFQPQNTQKGYEEKLKFMGMGSFLTTARIIPMSEWEVLSEKELENETLLKEILLPLTKITPQTSKENQLEVLNKITVQLDKTLTGNDAWEYKLGKELGEFLIELQRLRIDPSVSTDIMSLKPRLSKMKLLLSIAPNDFPIEILEKLNSLASLADSKNFNSEENKIKLFQIISETLNIISPGSNN